MEYLISFLEGIITFISPCLLPMLPIYITFFAGGNAAENKYRALKNSLGFVAGFTFVFMLLGIFAGTAGKLLAEHQTAINIVSGVIVIIFGLNFMGLLKISFLNKTIKMKMATKAGSKGFFSSMLFGIIFSVGWTPCVGAFLGSALILASQQGSAAKGILMLLCYSAGLGIPFVAAAVLIERLKGVFNFIKKNYKIINIISGVFLIIIGILMATGYMNYFISIMTP